VEVTDKEIIEIKINSVPKTQKTYVKLLKQLFASGSAIIGEYSPRLRLGEYSPIITSP
jgi:rRNA pseudouridine-1189 N-methylase Emg1 (Nep1/Mra1 family)